MVTVALLERAGLGFSPVLQRRNRGPAAAFVPQQRRPGAHFRRDQTAHKGHHPERILIRFVVVETQKMKILICLFNIETLSSYLFSII